MQRGPAYKARCHQATACHVAWCASPRKLIQTRFLGGKCTAAPQTRHPNNCKVGSPQVLRVLACCAEQPAPFQSCQSMCHVHCIHLYSLSIHTAITRPAGRIQRYVQPPTQHRPVGPMRTGACVTAFHSNAMSHGLVITQTKLAMPFVKAHCRVSGAPVLAHLCHACHKLLCWSDPIDERAMKAPAQCRTCEGWVAQAPSVTAAAGAAQAACTKNPRLSRHRPRWSTLPGRRPHGHRPRQRSLRCHATNKPLQASDHLTPASSLPFPLKRRLYRHRPCQRRLQVRCLQAASRQRCSADLKLSFVLVRTPILFLPSPRRLAPHQPPSHPPLGQHVRRLLRLLDVVYDRAVVVCVALRASYRN